MNTDHALMKPHEVAELFRVDPRTVTRWADTGLLRFIRTPGGHRRFLTAEVRGMYERSTQGGTT